MKNKDLKAEGWIRFFWLKVFFPLKIRRHPTISSIKSQTFWQKKLPGGNSSVSALLHLRPWKYLVKPLKEVIPETHIEHGNERSLQQTHQHVAPVVLVIRDPGVAHVHREGHQEELDGGPEKSGPLSHQSRLHVKLQREMELNGRRGWEMGKDGEQGSSREWIWAAEKGHQTFQK